MTDFLKQLQDTLGVTPPKGEQHKYEDVELRPEPKVKYTLTVAPKSFDVDVDFVDVLNTVGEYTPDELEVLYILGDGDTDRFETLYDELEITKTFVVTNQAELDAWDRDYAATHKPSGEPKAGYDAPDDEFHYPAKATCAKGVCKVGACGVPHCHCLCAPTF